MRTQRYRLFFLWCAENDHGDEENSKVEKSIEIEQEFRYMKEKVTTIIILRRWFSDESKCERLYIIAIPQSSSC